MLVGMAANPLMPTRPVAIGPAAWLEACLARRGIQTAESLEFGSLDAILGCVAAGGGDAASRPVAGPAMLG